MTRDDSRDGADAPRHPDHGEQLALLLEVAVAAGLRSFAKLGVVIMDGRVVLSEPEAMSQGEERYHQAMALTVARQLIPAVKVVRRPDEGQNELRSVVDRLVRAAQEVPATPVELFIESQKVRDDDEHETGPAPGDPSPARQNAADQPADGSGSRKRKRQ